MRIVFFVAVFNKDFPDNLPVIVGNYISVLQKVKNTGGFVVAVPPCPVAMKENHFYKQRFCKRFYGAFLPKKIEQVFIVPKFKPS